MRKTVATVAFVLVLASFVNGYLGKDKRSYATPAPSPASSTRQEAIGKQGGETLDDASRGKVRAEAVIVASFFDLPSASPTQTTAMTSPTTGEPLTDEPAINPRSTEESTQPTTPATKVSTTKATTTTEPSTTLATTTTTRAQSTTSTATTEPSTTLATTTTTRAQSTTASQDTKGYYCYDFETEVIRLINIERTKEGLGPVTLNQSLRSSAAVRALEIVDKFSHERPNGERWCTAIKINYKCAGENIASGQRTPEKVVQAWMNSEGHRKNIMNPRYTEVGVACYHDPDSTYRYYWGQLLIGHN